MALVAHRLVPLLLAVTLLYCAQAALMAMGAQLLIISSTAAAPEAFWLAEARAGSAQALVGEDPRVLETQAAVLMWRADALEGAGPVEIRRLQDHAGELLDRASRARPTWYGPEVQRIRLSSERFRLGAEFGTALREVLIKGPHEPEIQAVVALVVFTHWLALGSEARRIGRDAAISGLTHATWQQRDGMARLMTEFGAWPLVCNAPAVVERWQSRCAGAVRG